MAAVTMEWFTSGPANIVGGETGGEAHTLDWITDTVKVALLNALPNKDTAEFWSDISSTEVTGTGWAAGGVALTSKAILRDNASNRIGLDAADVSVPTVTVTGVTHIAVYKDTGTAATSALLGFGTLDVTSGSSGGTLSIPWNTLGILTFTS